MVVGALAAALRPEGAGAQPPDARACRDTDRDGLCDAAEDLDGDGRLDFGETDPRAADTDGDGTSDLVERQRGTDPARNGYLEFPEPMVFDKVRGLGAAQGEFEANVLVQAALEAGAPVLWAPEIEWAFAWGHAVELELGLADADLEILKGALQGTFFVAEDGGHAQGWQVLTEYLVDDRVLEPVVLHVMGIRLARAWSLVSLVGARLAVQLSEAAPVRAYLVANASLFAAVHPRVTVGLEGNLEASNTLALARAIPQLHWQIDHRFRLQAGVGFLWADDRPAAEAAARLIFEI